jgi:hypothetical protein
MEICSAKFFLLLVIHTNIIKLRVIFITQFYLLTAYLLMSWSNRQITVSKR